MLCTNYGFEITFGKPKILSLFYLELQMARFSEEELDEIRRSTDIVTLIESYGTKLKARPTSNEYVGQCPLHDDKDPSLHVNRAKGVWQCKGCGKQGDCFDWVQCAEKVSFPHSVELLKAKAVGSCLRIST